LHLKITESHLRSELDRRKKLDDRHKARTDLYYLLTEVMGRKDVVHPFLEGRCREVQQSPNGHIDLWAREHYKSTIITFALTIQNILCSHGEDPMTDKELTIGIFSHTRPSAKGFLRQIKREFESNQRLKDLFPDILYQNPSKEAVKWSEDDGIIVKRKSNPKEATVEAWGVVDGQPIGKHFDVLVYDDIVTAESVTTPEMIEKTTNALVLSYALGAEGGVRRFIGTRYHFADTYREIIKRGTASPRIYAITKDGTIEGEPYMMTAERVAEKRRDMGPYIFSCQMLQNPVADGAQGFKREWIKYYDKPPSIGNHYIVFDPAGEKKKSSDYSAGWVLLLGADKNIYVIDGVRDRLNLKERTDRLFEWHRKYQPIRNSGVRYEKYGMQADIEHIESRQSDEGYRFEVTPVGGITPKIDRIKRMLPYFEQGRVFFPRSMNRTDYQGKVYDLVQVFIEEEYEAFPVPLHDDMMDGMARLFEPDLPLVWPMPTPAQSPQQMRGGSWMG
jgi:predicted phage terminase large subunit-like protein